MEKRKPFYGWYLVAVTFLCYGLGITPAYISWSFYGPQIIEDFGFTRDQTGGVFGLFTFLYSGVGLLAGILQVYIGIRRVMVIGSLMAAFGMFMAARSDELWEFYLFYGIFGGGGIGLSTIVPAQTIGQNWFLKFRARAIAIIFFAGSVVGFVWPRFVAPDLLEIGGWRLGIHAVGWVSIGVAILAAVFVRDTPESLGQARDGNEAEPTSDALGNDATMDVDAWTASQAIRTPQFALIVVCGIAYALPWGVVSNQGRFHLADLGYDTVAAGALISLMFLISGPGRLSGSLGDWIKPQYVLAVGLAIEGLGTGGLLLADNLTMARICFVATGLGFGAAYISIPVVFASFFGRKAFGTTSGMRLLITGIFNASAPPLSGLAYEKLGSYAIPFITLMVLGLIGSIIAVVCPTPGLPPKPKSDTSTS